MTENTNTVAEHVTPPGHVVLGDGTDVTAALTEMHEAAHAEAEAAAPKSRLKRRDLLEVSALLRRNKLDPQDMAAIGLGVQFLQEKREAAANGTAMPRFQDWLDEDLPEDDDADGGEGEEDDPTLD